MADKPASGGSNEQSAGGRSGRRTTLVVLGLYSPRNGPGLHCRAVHV
jgi:hypothetical protein